ncbi:g6f-like isoform X2 [Brachyhypopomus gauderio]|uniref:g6f-like isoform X2 n=1 Tax=Brachyhypopomus gauderio TaxID=698409 RepID=UPI0040430335
MWTYSLFFALVCICEFLILLSTADRGPLTGSDWADVVIGQEGTAVTLPCSRPPPAQWDSWMMMSDGESHWTVLLSANASGGAEERPSRKLTQLGGRMFEIGQDASLRFIVTATGGGRYSCSTRVDGRKSEARIILLALVKLTITPFPTINMDSNVRLEARVSPPYVVGGGAWYSPMGVRLLANTSSVGTVLTKLPRVTADDSGLYTCSIRVRGRSQQRIYNYTLAVAVDVRHVAALPSIKYGPMHSVAVLSESPVSLPCPPVLGDYTRLYWWRPDASQNVQPELVYFLDHWRNRKKQTQPHLQLQRSAFPGHAGNTSFILKPAALADAGRYQCEVFLDDEAFGQVTTLTVLRGYSSLSSSSLNLRCDYAERSQVASVGWSHKQRPGLHLMQKAIIGRVTVTVALPVTPDTAGQYICTLHLKSGRVISYLHSLTLPSTERPCCASGNVSGDSAGSLLTPAEGNSVSEPSVLLPSLSLLLFLLPVSAVAVGLLLWRRGRCTLSRNAEHTLSHYSGEVENIYENPEDLRQSTPQATVYMALKPTDQMDVYRELDRYDKCCD